MLRRTIASLQVSNDIESTNAANKKSFFVKGPAGGFHSVRETIELPASALVSANTASDVFYMAIDDATFRQHFDPQRSEFKFNRPDQHFSLALHQACRYNVIGLGFSVADVTQRL